MASDSPSVLRLKSKVNNLAIPYGFLTTWEIFTSLEQSISNDYVFGILVVKHVVPGLKSSIQFKKICPQLYLGRYQSNWCAHELDNCDFVSSHSGGFYWTSTFIINSHIECRFMNMLLHWWRGHKFETFDGKPKFHVIQLIQIVVLDAFVKNWVYVCHWLDHQSYR